MFLAGFERVFIIYFLFIGIEYEFVKFAIEFLLAESGLDTMAIRLLLFFAGMIRLY